MDQSPVWYEIVVDGKVDHQDFMALSKYWQQ